MNKIIHRFNQEKAIFWLGQLAGKKALESLEEIAFSEDDTDDVAVF